MQWLTKKVTIVFGTESLTFFLTTLKYDTINLFIMSVYVCYLNLGLSFTFITPGTVGNIYLGSWLYYENEL